MKWVLNIKYTQGQDKNNITQRNFKMFDILEHLTVILTRGWFIFNCVLISLNVRPNITNHIVAVLLIILIRAVITIINIVKIGNLFYYYLFMEILCNWWLCPYLIIFTHKSTERQHITLEQLNYYNFFCNWRLFLIKIRQYPSY